MLIMSGSRGSYSSVCTVRCVSAPSPPLLSSPQFWLVADIPNQICDISVQAVAGGAAPSHLVRRTEVGAARREGASFRFDEFAVKQNISDLEIISTGKIF